MYFKTMVIQTIYVFYCHSCGKVIFVRDIRSSGMSNVADIKCGGKKELCIQPLSASGWCLAVQRWERRKVEERRGGI